MVNSYCILLTIVMLQLGFSAWILVLCHYYKSSGAAIKPLCKWSIDKLYHPFLSILPQVSQGNTLFHFRYIEYTFQKKGLGRISKLYNSITNPENLIEQL